MLQSPHFLWSFFGEDGNLLPFYCTLYNICDTKMPLGSMWAIESKINYSPKFSFDCLIAQDKFKRRKKLPRTQK